MSAVRELDTTTFDETVAAGGLVLVDFWASWCGPCKMIAPIIDQLAGERPDVIFAKVDVDAYPALAQRFGIRGIPALLIFDGSSTPVAEVSGAQPKRVIVEALDDAASAAADR